MFSNLSSNRVRSLVIVVVLRKHDVDIARVACTDTLGNSTGVTKVRPKSRDIAALTFISALARY